MTGAKVTEDDSIIEVEGEIDIAVSTNLQEKLSNLLARGARYLVIDLHGVTFMDCSAIRSVMSAHRTAAARGGSVLLVAPSNMIKRVLDITGVSRALPIYSSQENALRFGGGEPADVCIANLAIHHFPDAARPTIWH